MAATATVGFFRDLSVEEHNELVQSVGGLHESVGRVILIDKKTKVVTQTGTASLVYKADEWSIFLTCEHNFKEKICGEMIRLQNGNTLKDYPVEHIIYRHKGNDLLFFSVKDPLPQHHCLEFCSNEVKGNDKVVLLGYFGGPLLINDKEIVPAPVVAHSILTGVVCVDPFEKDDQHYLKVHYTCQAIQGHSGSPIFKDGKLVAVHLGADKDWRDGISINTVLHSLREYLGLGTDNKDTIDKLLEGLYNKSGHVPDAIMKSKGKARTG